MSEKDFLAKLKEHQGIIYKLVLLYASGTEDRKDLYQEILYQAWKSYPMFRGDSRFSTWLYRLCLNTIFTSQKKVSKIEYTDAGLEERLAGEDDSAGDSQRLYQAMRTLPETERAVVSLHLDGYSNQEIASILGITPNHAGVKFHRAKQQLAKMLNDI